MITADKLKVQRCGCERNLHALLIFGYGSRSTITVGLCMDDRLAALKQEIDKILSIGPIGRWTNPPTTFPMMWETVRFDVDGSGLATSFCSTMGTRRQAFEWSMEFPGRLVMRYGRCEYDGEDGGVEEATDDGAEEPADEDESIVCAIDLEIKIEETEFAPWPVMTSRSSDVFGHLWCALARVDPPLVLPRRLSVGRVR